MRLWCIFMLDVYKRQALLMRTIRSAAMLFTVGVSQEGRTASIGSIASRQSGTCWLRSVSYTHLVCSTSAQTIPSLAPAQLFCMAISTALKALVTTDETFIAQLLEAPSQIMPVISLTILIIAVLMVLMSRVNSHRCV